MPKKETCYISLGSNLNDRKENLYRAIELLKGNPQIDVTATSDFLESKPLAGLVQPDFLNAVVQIETSLLPVELLTVTSDIEAALGRQRHTKWSSRQIDLDILLYGRECIDESELTIPHRQMHLRSFVLNPLCELAPDLVHPVLGETISTLAGRLNGGDFFIDLKLPLLISVAGIIGVGKTTLVNNLAEILEAEKIFEDYSKNPFLPQVYAGKKELALDCQKYFLNSRVEQLSRDRLKAGRIYISDYIFDQETIYAKRWLDQEQLSAYMIDYKHLSREVFSPVLAIYLYDSAEKCLERIHHRNRPYEQVIELSRLRNFAEDYEHLFKNWRISPVIRICTSDLDFRIKKDVEVLAKQVKNYISG